MEFMSTSTMLFVNVAKTSSRLFVACFKVVLEASLCLALVEVPAAAVQGVMPVMVTLIELFYQSLQTT
jgi:hypothetical protein